MPEGALLMHSDNKTRIVKKENDSRFLVRNVRIYTGTTAKQLMKMCHHPQGNQFCTTMSQGVTLGGESHSFKTTYGLLKQKLNFFGHNETIFGGKMSFEASEQDWCTSQKGWHHEKIK